MIRRFITRFRAQDFGAVTIDWLVMTALAIALVAVISATLGGGLQDGAAALFN